MNAVKDTSDIVDQQRIPAFLGNGAEEEKRAEAQLGLKEDVQVQPRAASSDTRKGAGESTAVELKRKVIDDETEKGGVSKKARTFDGEGIDLQPRPPAGSGDTRKDTDEPAPSLPKPKLQDEPEKTEGVDKKKARTDQEEPRKIVLELDLSGEDDTARVDEGEEGIRKFTEKDVLCGRGGATNVHPGNKKFRDIVDQHRRTYLEASKRMKPRMNRAIVNALRKDGARFLKREKDGLWYEVGDRQAREKVGQALRQRAPEMRKLLFKEDPKNSKVSQEQLRQAREQLRRSQDQQRKQEQELNQQIEQRQLKQLEQLQQQQLQQQQMALAAASIGSVQVDPLMLANPLMLQQAMANPVFTTLLAMNKVVVPVVQTVNLVPPVPTNPFPTVPALAGMNLAAAALTPMTNGGLILPQSQNATNNAAAPVPTTVNPAPLAVPTTGGLIPPKPEEAP